MIRRGTGPQPRKAKRGVETAATPAPIWDARAGGADACQSRPVEMIAGRRCRFPPLVERRLSG